MTYGELSELKAYARKEGITMSELGHRGGMARVKKWREVNKYKAYNRKYSQMDLEGMWWNKD
jgi:hypothetical protein